MTTTIPQAQCVRHAEEIIINAVKSGTIQAGPIACWSNDGAEIIVTGKLLTKGYWPCWCIRWRCPANGGKGLFGAGLVGYNGEFTADQLKTLEVTK